MRIQIIRFAKYYKLPSVEQRKYVKIAENPDTFVNVLSLPDKLTEDMYFKLSKEIRPMYIRNPKGEYELRKPYKKMKEQLKIFIAKGGFYTMPAPLQPLKPEYVKTMITIPSKKY